MNDYDSPTCPGCGGNGTFDGQGDKTEFSRKVRVDDNGVARESKVVREWKQFQCTECGCTFRLLNDETETEKPGRVKS